MLRPVQVNNDQIPILQPQAGDYFNDTFDVQWIAGMDH